MLSSLQRVYYFVLISNSIMQKTHTHTYSTHEPNKLLVLCVLVGIFAIFFFLSNSHSLSIRPLGRSYSVVLCLIVVSIVCIVWNMITWTRKWWLVMGRRSEKKTQNMLQRCTSEGQHTWPKWTAAFSLPLSSSLFFCLYHPIANVRTHSNKKLKNFV